MFSRILATSLRTRLHLALALAILAAGIPAGLALKAQLDRIADSKRELSGIDPALAAIKLVFEMQTHRRASVARLAGDQAVAADRVANAERIERQFDTVKRAFAASGLPLDDNPEWKATLDAWPGVKQTAGNPKATALDVIEGQTQMIMSALGVIEQAGASSGLLLDPSEAAYYLVINALGEGQQLKEYIGHLRGHGVAVLAARKVDMPQRLELYANVGKIDDTLRNYRRNLDRAVAANPELGQPLAAKFAKVEHALQAATRLAQQDLVQAQSIARATGEYAAVTRVAIDTMAELNDATLQTLKATLQERINADRREAVLLAIALLTLTAATALTLRSVNRTVRTGIGRASSFAHAIARQDLSQRLLTRRTDEMGDLLRALDGMGQSLSGIVCAVRAGASGFAMTSHEISSASNDLSARTEEAASNLEQTAASMSQLTTSVQLNADAARQAHDFARTAAAVADRGGSAVSEVVGTMDEINGASRRIADITGVIDGIAFQTNILALNAAVEAARAGEQGRGFAVVASEVRSLAQRSANAAKEIKSLIEDSVGKVDTGSALVGEAGKTMTEIVEQVRRVTGLVAEINASTNEQSSGIVQVNQSVASIDQGTQQNAALVEESAAAAESLKQQASGLLDVIARFKTRDQHAAGHA